MSAVCARKSSRTPRIRAILKRYGEADTSSRWIRKWLERPAENWADNRAVMQFKFWPRTLRVQLILVVAAAVAISNLGVAFYFYKNSEAQTRDFVTERMIDRA